jgi:hypothetical protein
MNATPAPAPQWMSVVLFIAGVYNIAWGTWIGLFPADSFYQFWNRTAEEPLCYRLWQGAGMVVGVYGIGYIITARDPVRYWPVVFLGLLMKVFGPIGMLYGVSRGEFPDRMLPLMYPNDLIWWVPFALILGYASRIEHSTSPPTPPGA